MGRTWQFGLLLLLGVGFAFGIRFYLKSSKADPIEVNAPLPLTKVVALGRIQPKTGVLDVNGVSGQRILSLKVQEGDSVKKGAVLATVDTHPVAVASLAYAKSQLEAGYRQLAAKKASAETTLKQAQADLENVAEKARFDLEVQDALIQKITRWIADNEDQIGRMKVLVEKGAMAQIELERKTTELNDQKQQLAEAQIDLQKLKNSQKMARLNAESVVETDRAKLVLDEATTDVESLKNNVKLQEAKLSECLITAPEDGLVLQIYHRPGEAIGTEPVLKMANLNQMIALTEVYETDVHLVKAGQKATITSPALTNEVTGSVVSIGRLVEQQGIYSNDPSVSTDARVVDVTVSVDRPELVNELVNLQVQVSIEVAEHQTEPVTKKSVQAPKP